MNTFSHNHSYIDYTEQELENCPACQRNRDECKQMEIRMKRVWLICKLYESPRKILLLSKFFKRAFDFAICEKLIAKCSGSELYQITPLGLKFLNEKWLAPEVATITD